MGWSADKEVLSDEEADELMGVGAMISADIEELVKSVSSAIKMDFRHGVTLLLGGAGTRPTRSAWIVLLFTITDLGGSDQAHVKTFIVDRLREMLEEPAMSRYPVRWGFEVEGK